MNYTAASFGLKALNFLLNLLPDFAFDIPEIEATAEVLNIFAWINYFIPTALIGALLVITAAWYGFKLLKNIFDMGVDLFF